MPWEYDERERQFAREQAKLKFMADELGDTLSVYTVSKTITDWIADPSEDLSVLCTMANAYSKDGDFEELGRHVANYVRGMWELIAKHKMDCSLPPTEEDDE